MPGPETSVRSAPKTAWTPSPEHRKTSVSRRLVAVGVSLLVGAVVLALLALALPSSTRSATASATAATSHVPSHQATTAATAHKATASKGTSSAPTPSRTQRNIAKPRVIKLHRGDTLWSLARRYNTTVAALQALNGLGTSTLIYAGRDLRLPADSSAGTGTRASTTSAPTPGTSPATDADAVVSGNAATAVAYAKAQLGKPYAWGATGPNAYDCSGLVMRAWQAAGVQLPRTTYQQVNTGHHITRTQLRPGDLIFTNDNGHVQLYIGAGQVIEAPHTGAQIRISPLPPATQVDAYERVTQPTTPSSPSSTATAPSKAATTRASPSSTRPSASPLNTSSTCAPARPTSRSCGTRPTLAAPMITTGPTLTAATRSIR